ncbi:MAG: AAA family ATPase [bacterium]
MSRIIAVVNQKGGVGKTTTAINLAACLGRAEKKVLLIDMDPQGNATSGLGINKNTVKKSIYDVLINGVNIEDTIALTENHGVVMIPSNIHLTGAEVELVSILERESKLKTALQAIKNNYDYIIIDCPPSLGLLTVNSLNAADGVIIPVQCEYYALEGLSQLLNTIKLVKERLNFLLEIDGALLTMHDERTNLSKQVIQEIQKYFADKVYKTIISRNVRLSESPSYGKPIIYYDIKSRGAQMYLQFCDEVLKSTQVRADRQNIDEKKADVLTEKTENCQPRIT